MSARPSIPLPLRRGLGSITRDVTLTPKGWAYIGGSRRSILVPPEKLRLAGPVAAVEVSEARVVFWLDPSYL